MAKLRSTSIYGDLSITGVIKIGSGDNQIIIGQGAVGQGANTVVLGNASVTKGFVGSERIVTVGMFEEDDGILRINTI